jgi:hypothetical protein
MTLNPSATDPSVIDSSASDLSASDSRAIDPSAGWDNATQAAARPSGGYRDDHGLGRLPGMVLVLSLKHRVALGVARGHRAALTDGRESGRTSRLHG